MNIIVTPRLLLRPLADSDSADFISLFSFDPPAVAAVSAEPLLSLFSAYRRAFDEQGWGMFAVIDRREKKFIGICGLIEDHMFSAAELTVHLIASAQDKGYATEAAMQIIQRAFSEWNISRIVASTSPENTAAIEVMKKIGMYPDTTDLLPFTPNVRYEIRSEQQQPPMRPFRQTMTSHIEPIAA